MFTKILTTKNRREKRLATCKSCENYTKIHTCNLCGCFMPIKTYLKKSDCPANKWGNIFNSWS